MYGTSVGLQAVEGSFELGERLLDPLGRTLLVDGWHLWTNLLPRGAAAGSEGRLTNIQRARKLPSRLDYALSIGTHALKI